MKLLALIPPALLLGACSAGDIVPRPASGAPPIPGGTAGLDRVMGQTAPRLIAEFGRPAADVREGTARKLQFGNATCVLDAYLYPQRGREPVVTYIDARQTDGSPIDRASCIGALLVARR